MFGHVCVCERAAFSCLEIGPPRILTAKTVQPQRIKIIIKLTKHIDDGRRREREIEWDGHGGEVEWNLYIINYFTCVYIFFFIWFVLLVLESETFYGRQNFFRCRSFLCRSGKISTNESAMRESTHRAFALEHWQRENTLVLLVCFLNHSLQRANANTKNARMVHDGDGKIHVWKRKES